jgi:hypothetical protein
MIPVRENSEVVIFYPDVYIYIYWLVVYLPLRKMMEFVSWDDEIPNIWKNNIYVPNHQPGICVYIYDSTKIRV